MHINDLKKERERIFYECNNLVSPLELLVAQESIIESILQCENEIKKSMSQKDVLKSHIAQLRLLGDGLAWSLLHPHTIRQFAKNTSKPPSLIHQEQFFQQIISYCFDYVKKHNTLILISDITNIIGAGDFLICSDPEYPIIVECKNKLPLPENLLQGRIGRQISRGISTAKYLHSEEGKIFGNSRYNFCVPTSHQAKRNWDAVSLSCKSALKNKNGYSIHKLSEYEVIGAHIKGKETAISEYLNNSLKSAFLSSPTCYFGTSSGLLNMFDGLFASPIVWPISKELSFEILEKDLIVIHAIDSRAFKCKSEDGTEMEILPSKDYPIVVTINGKKFPFSLRFIYDVLYGFETLESCINGLFDFAIQIEIQNVDHNAVEGHKKIPNNKPTIFHFDSIEKLKTFISKEVKEKNSYIALSEDLFNQISVKLNILELENMRLTNPNIDSSHFLFDVHSFLECIKNRI